jgi:hypothetical protein
MNTPKFFALIASSKEKSSDPRFRVFVELGDKDKDFWESQVLGTAEGRAQMTALRNGLKEVLPGGTELSEAPVATFFEGDAEAIIEKAEPIIAKDGRRAWIVQD